MDTIVCPQSSRRLARWVACPAIAGLVMLPGCAHPATYVRNDTLASLDYDRSAKHEFTDLEARIDEEEHQLVVYGKVSHADSDCPEDGHVDLAVVDAAGVVLARQSLPLVNRGVKRGWHGASFRTRLNLIPPKNGQLRLSLHDARCVEGGAYDCGSNRAAGAR